MERASHWRVSLMSTVCSTWSWLRMAFVESSVTLLTRNWNTFWYWRNVKLWLTKLASSMFRLASRTRESTPSAARARSKRRMAADMRLRESLVT
jgi:hypothetical protein